MPPQGLEQVDVNGSNDDGLRKSSNATGAESGAVGAGNGPIDADLTRLIEAWPAMTKRTKQAVLGLLGTAKDTAGDVG